MTMDISTSDPPTHSHLPENIHILVTGGSGFLGAYTVKALQEKHPTWQISVLDRNDPPVDIRHRIAAFVSADVTSQSSVDAAFAALPRPPDLVIHSAGVVPARALRYSTSSAQWKRVEAINYHGTQHVLAAVRASGCRRVVYTSSCTTIIDDLAHDYYHMSESSTRLGLATLHYGRSKGLAEQAVLDARHATDWGLLACALRPATIIGEGDTAVIGLMHALIAKRETGVVVGDGHNIYDFMHVANAADAHVLAAENLLGPRPSAAGLPMFISNQEPVYFWDFLAAVWAQFGHVPPRRVRIPVEVAWLAGWTLEWITWLTGGETTLDRGSVKDGVRTQYSDNTRAREVLGYVPRVSMAEAVRRSCADYKQHLAQKEAMNDGKGM